MRLIITGSEYAGKTTLVNNVKQWIMDEMGAVTHISLNIHDHWIAPELMHPFEHHEEEEEQIRTFTPSLLEKYLRYMIQFHFDPQFYRNDDYIHVDWYYADAVYAPMYYGYGGPGQLGDRVAWARRWDGQVLATAPDTVLVLLKASPEAIRRRIRENPHPKGRVKEADVDRVLKRFQEEYDNSLLFRRAFVLDTTETSPAETLQEFVRQMEIHLSPVDRVRLVTHQALKKS